jgi:hypothetical protein
MFRYLIFFLLTIVFAQDALVVESSIVAKGLNKPLLVRFHPETNTMYVIQQTGEIVIVNNEIPSENLFLDISNKIALSVMPGDERGFLGMVFDPNYIENGYFYICYIDKDNHSVVSRMQ